MWANESASNNVRCVSRNSDAINEKNDVLKKFKQCILHEDDLTVFLGLVELKQDELQNKINDAADIILHFAENPENDQFKNAVTDRKKALEELGFYQRVQGRINEGLKYMRKNQEM